LANEVHNISGARKDYHDVLMPVDIGTVLGGIVILGFVLTPP